MLIGALSSQLFVLPFSQHEQQEDANANAAKEKPAEKIDWHNWTNDPISVFTAVLTGFNGLLFVSTIALWLANRKTAKISERALTELERPFIVIEGIKSDLNFYLSPSSWDERIHNPTFVLSVINYGRTPGNIDFAAIYFVVSDKIPDQITRLHLVSANPEAESMEIIIGQGTTYRFPQMRCLERLKNADVKPVREGARHVYCHGLFIYRDIFGNTHTTRFCRRYWVERNEWPPDGGKERNHAE